jgi:phosphonate metabolism protein (transferase hexapeptide repeat family)
MSPKPSSLAFIDMFPEPGEGCDGDSMHAHRKRRLSEKPYIHPTSRVMKSRLGGYTAIGPHCSLRESEFGDYSYTAGDVSMVWTSVGNFCSIASHTRINPGNHSYWRVTQSHCTYRRVPYGFDTKDDEEFFAWRKADHVDIGHDVWLGHGVTVMPGAKIATGAAVGAGAVVVKAHPIGPYEIAVGIPARPIRKRFPDQVIEKLMAIEYWYWDRKTLEERFNDLLDIDVFLEKYGM